MEFLVALLTGILFAAGIYSILRRSLVKILLGFALLSHAANILIFTSGGFVRDVPPLIPPGQTVPPRVFSDPLPQAMVLTAIVISFGISAFFVSLVFHANRKMGTDDVGSLREEGP